MRHNGKFQYAAIPIAEQDPNTGFYKESGEEVWMEGCRCQIDKSIPAKQIVGSDGQMFQYTYDVLLFEADFKGELGIGMNVRLIFDNGKEDEMTIQGIDETNGRYIEIWG